MVEKVVLWRSLGRLRKGKLQLALSTLHHLVKIVVESAKGKRAGYFLLDLFPVILTLTVVVVQCSSGGGGCCSLSSSSSTTYQCNILCSCSYVFVAHLSLLYTSNIQCTLPCRYYTVFVSSFL